MTGPRFNLNYWGKLPTSFNVPRFAVLLIKIILLLQINADRIPTEQRSDDGGYTNTRHDDAV